MHRDWMPTTQSIERVSGRSQEREFSMQRQGDKISDFGPYSTAETAQTKKLGTHVFDNSDVSRVSLSHHNYGEWVVETRWIETGCPPLSPSNESPVGARNGNFRCRDKATKSATLARIQQQRLRKPKNQGRMSLTSRTYCECLVNTTTTESGWWAHQGSNLGPAD